MLPGASINGLDCSQYAIENSKDEIRKDLIQGCASKLPYNDNSFDLAISINTLHCLENFKLSNALSELERVSAKDKYVCVESFRNEVEKFLLWSFLIKDTNIDSFKKSEILDYADFCWKPPVSWIGTSNVNKFKFENGYFEFNKKWRPFKMQAPKSQIEKECNKKKYKPSQQTLVATFTAIIAFYKFLMNEDL